MEIFNSDKNYSKNLILFIDDYKIIPEKITFNHILKNFIDIDFEVTDAIACVFLNKLESYEHTFKFFPDSTTGIFFETSFNNITTFLIDNKIFYKICSKNLILHTNETIIDNFCEDFNIYSKKVLVNEEETLVVEEFYKKQFEPHWFNDQNVFVEKEYNRIKKILDKQINQNPNFDASILRVNTAPSNSMKLLHNLTGLNIVKEQVQRLYATLEYQKNNGLINNNSLHMCFYGNPGTGKTTVARIISGILFDFGLINKNKCVEINGLELKGNNVGQTSLITKNVLDFAKGGVLFIDEAYTLFDKSKDNFGIEAINILLKEMEDNRNNLVIILAGYYNPMQNLLDSNVGFRSRIKYFFDFEDYNETELFEIFMNLCRNVHLFVDKDAMKQLIVVFKNVKTRKNFGNGRFVENILSKIEEQHILNVSFGKSNPDTISLNDLEDLACNEM